MSWRTINLKAISTQLRCKSMQLITPQGLHSELMNACTHGQKFGTRKITIAHNNVDESSKGRREDRINFSICLVALGTPVFIRRKQAIGGVRKICQKERKWLER